MRKTMMWSVDCICGPKTWRAVAHWRKWVKPWCDLWTVFAGRRRGALWHIGGKEENHDVILALHLRAEDVARCGKSHSDNCLLLVLNWYQLCGGSCFTVSTWVVSFAAILLAALISQRTIAQYYTLQRVPRSVFTLLWDKATPLVCSSRNPLPTYANVWCSVCQVRDLQRTFVMLQTEHLKGWIKLWGSWILCGR
jgi:hypothetical protein